MNTEHRLHMHACVFEQGKGSLVCGLFAMGEWVTDEQGTGNELDGGAIAGISIGAVTVVAVAVVLLVYFFIIKPKRRMRRRLGFFSVSSRQSYLVFWLAAVLR